MLTLLGTFPAQYDESRLKRKLQTLPDRRVAGVAASTQVGLAFTILVLSFFATDIGQGVRNNWKTNPISVLLWSGVFIVIVLTLAREWPSEFRNRSLLEKGGFAVGRVTSQIEVKAGRSGTRSEITYTFADASGRTWNGTATDQTKRYVTSMPVIVFYDEKAPAHNVVPCATAWKLRGLDGEFLDLD
jgi:hypothetical protein